METIVVINVAINPKIQRIIVAIAQTEKYSNAKVVIVYCLQNKDAKYITKQNI